MRKIKELFYNAGGFIVVLSLAAIVLRLSEFNKLSSLSKIDAIISVIGLLFGLAYAFRGYIKDSYKLYKVFAITYAISTVVSLISCYVSISSLKGMNIFVVICHALVSILVITLAVVKNLGKKKSFYLSYAVIFIEILLFFITLITNVQYVVISLGNLVLACIETVFIVSKYVDKASRGAD